MGCAKKRIKLPRGQGLSRRKKKEKKYFFEHRQFFLAKLNRFLHWIRNCYYSLDSADRRGMKEQQPQQLYLLIWRMCVVAT